MKRKSKILLALLVVALLICIVTVTLAACDGDKGSNPNGGTGGTTPGGGGDTPGGGGGGTTPGGGDTPSVTTYYTVSFNTMGGTPIDPVQVESGKTVARPKDPTKAGSSFVNWYLDADREGDPYDFSSKVVKDITLYALWNDENFTVTYDTDGGYPIPKYSTVTYGTQISEPTAPKKQGFTLEGWYKDPQLKNKVSFPFKVEQSTVLYAKWNDNDALTVNYKICYDYDNWLGTSDALYTADIKDVMPADSVYSVERGGKLDFPGKPGDIQIGDRSYEFYYWSLDSSYHTAQTRAALFPIVCEESDITLYAVYGSKHDSESYPPAKLVVHVDDNEKPFEIYGYKGHNVYLANLDAANPNPFYTDFNNCCFNGQRPTGYYKSKEFTIENVYQVPFELTNDVNDVYIRWEKMKDVPVHIENYTPGVDNDTKWTDVAVPYAGKLEKPTTQISPLGYTFNAYFVSYDGETYNVVDDVNRWEFDINRVYSEIWLKADWVKSATVLSFDTDAGYKLGSVCVDEGDRISYDMLPVPYKEVNGLCYNFLSWELDGRVLDEHSEFVVDSTKTLKAKWGANPIDISNFDFILSTTANRYHIRAKLDKKDDIKGVLELPMQYAGADVTVVERSGFENCTNITKVIAGKTYVSFYNHAFKGCKNLQEMQFDSDKLRQFGDGMLEDCTKLTTIGRLKSAPRLICNGIFNDCVSPSSFYKKENGLAYLETDEGNVLLGTIQSEDKSQTILAPSPQTPLYNNVITFATWSLKYLKNLETLEIPDSCVSFAEDIFPETKNCSLKNLKLNEKLESHTLPQNWPVTLETLQMPSSNKSYTLTNGCLIKNSDKSLVCSTVSATTIPDSVKVIASYGWSKKTGETVQIPSSVERLDSMAFYQCEYTSLVIPDNVGAIDQKAVYQCENLESLNIGKNANKLTNTFFSSINSSVIAHIDISQQNVFMLSQDSVVYDKQASPIEIIYAAEGYKGDLTLKDGLEKVEEWTFEGQYDRFVFPDSVKEIGGNPFRWATVKTLSFGANFPKVNANDIFGATNLGTVFEVSESNPYMIEKDGVVYTKDMKQILFVSGNIRDLSIPDSVTYIANGINLLNLNKLTLPASFTLDMFKRLFFGYSFYADGLTEEDEEWIEHWEWVMDNEITPPTAIANEIEISPENKELAVYKGVVYTKDYQQLLYIPTGFTGDLEIPVQLKTLSSGILTDATSKYLPGEYMVNVFSDIYEPEEGETPPTENHISTKLVIPKDSALESVADKAFGATSFNTKFIVSISEYDFSNALKLNSIGSSAFGTNGDVTKIILPQKEIKVGSWAFGYCPNLATIEADFDKMILLGRGAFTDSPKLLDEQNMFIKNNALLFWKYEGEDETLQVPEGITRIMTGAIDLDDVRCIKIPSSVQTIDKEGVRAGVVSLFEIQVDLDAIPDGYAKEEGKDVWYSAQYGFVNILLNGKQNEKLYGSADDSEFFYEFDTTTSTATLIDDHTLSSELSGKVTIPSKVSKGGQQYTVTTIADYAFARRFIVKTKNATEYVLPDTIITIGKEAFDNHDKLETITIPASVTSIGDDVFSRCTALKFVDVTEGNALYQSKDGVVYNKQDKSIYFVPRALQGDVTILDGCPGLSSSLEKRFSSSGIVSIVIPGSVKSIIRDAFEYCKSLQKVTICEGVTKIENGAFDSCTALQEIIIPASVTIVENNAFYSCKALKNVYYGGSKTTWASISIGNNNNSTFKNAERYYYADEDPYLTNPSDNDLYWHWNKDRTAPEVWAKQD